MGRISAHIRITNLLDPAKSIEIDALVDTGSAYLVLPKAWQERLGDLRVFRTVDCETATQQIVEAAICGPVLVEIEGFAQINCEVMFLEMSAKKDSFGLERYEPLLGFLPLESANIAVDVLGQRLIALKYTDLK